MDKFIEECIKLNQNNGFEYNEITMKVGIYALLFAMLLLDRALLKNIKLHFGYSGCEQCTQRDVWEGKMTHPDLNSLLRTDQSFSLRL